MLFAHKWASKHHIVIIKTQPTTQIEIYIRWRVIIDDAQFEEQFIHVKQFY